MSWKFSWSLCFLLLISKTTSNKTSNTLREVWDSKNWENFPHNPTDVSTIMFHRFANEERKLTVAGFEKLVECSIGLSHCPELSDVEEKPINYLTDCSINADLSHLQCKILNSCLKGKDMLSLLPSFDATTDYITEDQLKSLLPSILYQAQSQVCKTEQSEKESSHKYKPTTLEVWGYAFLFVTLISGCSLAGVSVMPLMQRDFYQKLLTVLIGLAVGSLAASAVFHLIPQAYGLTGMTEHHTYLTISLYILLGIYVFFMIERILKIIFTIQKLRSKNAPNSMSTQTILTKGNGEINVGDSRRNSENVECSPSFTGVSPVVSGLNVECDGGSSPQSNSCGYPSKDIQLIYASQEQAIKASFGHEQKPERLHEEQEIHFQQGKDSPIATVAWMIIFGDGFHNFIDGVSIGAAFQQSTLTGISISLAVMCEELPHELGDFAVLLNSGMTMKQALFYNFLSATTCYVGMIVGIVVGEFTQDSTFIFALAAGMFLYISLVDMLPEMNETASRAAEKSIKDVFYVLLLQNIGMMLGVFSLFVLAYYQDNITLD